MKKCDVEDFSLKSLSLYIINAYAIHHLRLCYMSI